MRRFSSHRAFSLVELMVTIGVIAILIAIALPALGGARDSAQRIKALANMGSTQTIFERYASDHGRYPFRAAGDQPAGIDPPVEPDALTFPWYPEGVVIATTDHFGLDLFWPAIVAPIDEWPSLADVWISPGKDARLPTLDELLAGDDFEPADVFSIVYSNSFVARPTLWMPDRADAVDRVHELRPTNPGEVRFPAQKVMLWDKDIAYLNEEFDQVGGHKRAPTPMAFADGHADARDPTEATPGIANPLRGGDERTLHNTPEGVYGIDFK